MKRRHGQSARRLRAAATAVNGFADGRAIKLAPNWKLVQAVSVRALARPRESSNFINFTANYIMVAVAVRISDAVCILSSGSANFVSCLPAYLSGTNLVSRRHVTLATLGPSSISPSRRRRGLGLICSHCISFARSVDWPIGLQLSPFGRGNASKNINNALPV